MTRAWCLYFFHEFLFLWVLYNGGSKNFFRKWQKWRFYLNKLKKLTDFDLVSFFFLKFSSNFPQFFFMFETFSSALVGLFITPTSFFAPKWTLSFRNFFLVKFQIQNVTSFSTKLFFEIETFFRVILFTPIHKLSIFLI